MQKMTTGNPSALTAEIKYRRIETSKRGLHKTSQTARNKILYKNSISEEKEVNYQNRSYSPWMPSFK